MIGRQVIPTNRAFTLEELEAFMQAHWDKQEYNDFFLGKPTAGSLQEYICLPATQRFMVIAYGKKAGGLFNKENKVVLTVCDAPGGIVERLATSVPSNNIFFGIWKTSTVMSTEKERKGPAEEVLQKYTAYMKKLLGEAGYLK